MSLDVKRIPILKTEIPAGLCPLVISDLKLHKKSNGEVITYQENPGVIVTFKHNDLIHQELYWIGGHNYTKLQKIILQVGLDPAMEIHKKEFVGKTVSGLIKEFKTMRGGEEIKSEKRLVETFEYAGGFPDIKFVDFIEYLNEGF